MKTMTSICSVSGLRILGLAIALSVGSIPAFAQEMDHSKMQMPPAAPAAKPPATKPEEAVIDHAAMGHNMPIPTDQPREPIPELSQADRIAAFPDVDGHAAHDRVL